MPDVKSSWPEFSVDEKGVERRFVPMRLTEQDAALLQEVFPVIKGHVDDIVDAFYCQLLDYEDTKGVFRTKSTVRRLKSSLRNYLKAVLNCTLDRGYFKGRVNIAQKFDFPELPPRSYLAIYNLLKRLIAPIVTEAYKGNAKKAQDILNALDKVFFLDATLAMDSYVDNQMAAMEEAYKKVMGDEREWEDTFNSITDFVSIHDKDFNIVMANKAVYEKFGITENDLGKKKCYEIFHSTDEYWPTCPLVKAKESLEPAASEIDDPRMGGVFMVSAFPRFNESGEFTGVVSIAKNITEQKELERELERLVVVDDLTGLSNRRRFYELLTSMMAGSKRYGHPLSLLFFDLDNFKDYNDAYGHVEGDVVLREVARCAQKLVRQDVDFCCRYGGEEFTVILPETSKEGALNAAERLRGEVEGLEFRPKTVKDASKPVKMTVSVGVTEFKDYDADDFVEKADSAMYEAKKQGKNKVAVFG